MKYLKQVLLSEAPGDQGISLRKEVQETIGRGGSLGGIMTFS